MTAPTSQQQSIDMGRVAHRASQGIASAVGDLALQLAVAQEMADTTQQRVADLEEQLREKDAELARVRQTSELLQQQLRQLDPDPSTPAPDDTDARQGTQD